MFIPYQRCVWAFTPLVYFAFPVYFHVCVQEGFPVAVGVKNCNGSRQVLLSCWLSVNLLIGGKVSHEIFK